MCNFNDIQMCLILGRIYIYIYIDNNATCDFEGLVCLTKNFSKPFIIDMLHIE